MKVRFEEKPCIVKEELIMRKSNITSEGLAALRTSVLKAEKDFSHLKKMATNLQNMQDHLY